MHAFQTAASAFCIACICAEITTLLVGAGWAGRCIKAVAGLYILVILFRLAPQMKLELKSASAAAPAAVSIQSTETSLLQGPQERLEAALWYKGETGDHTDPDRTDRSGRKGACDPPGGVHIRRAEPDRGISAAGAWHGTDT